MPMKNLLTLISIISFFSCDDPEVYGCTISTAFNFNPDANIYDDSCCYLSGCMDSTAYNFDVEACFDDDDCEYLGCMDEEACNYNPDATIGTINSNCSYGGWEFINGVCNEETLEIMFALEPPSGSNGYVYYNQLCDSDPSNSNYLVDILGDNQITPVAIGSIVYYPELFIKNPSQMKMGNGIWDEGEEFTDLNGNGQWDSFENSLYSATGIPCSN